MRLKQSARMKEFAKHAPRQKLTNGRAIIAGHGRQYLPMENENGAETGFRAVRLKDSLSYLNSERMICGALFAIERACTPSCCFVCRAVSCALSLAMSASTRLPMP